MERMCKEICEFCRSFSGVKSAQKDVCYARMHETRMMGWCLKRRKTVSRGDTCDRFRPEDDGRYEQTVKPIDIFVGE